MTKPIAQILSENAPPNTRAPAPGFGLTLDERGNIPRGVSATSVRMLTADPASPRVGEIWYRTDTSELCIQEDATTIKTVAFT